MNQLIAFFISILLLVGCTEQVSEVKEDISSATENAICENEVMATIEAVADWIGSYKFSQKTDGIIPEKATIVLGDTTFLDGDGVDGMIDFGLPGNTEPYGLLCCDTRYRAGKVHFYLDKPFNFPGSKLTVEIAESDSFYSGTGEYMQRMFGKFQLQVNGPQSLQFVADSITMFYPGEVNNVKWSCNYTLSLIEDAGLGMWGDVYSTEGTSSGINTKGEHFTATIIKPLLKTLKAGCSKVYVDGKTEVSNSINSTVLLLNYDPVGDKACDQLTEISINGRKRLFYLE